MFINGPFNIVRLTNSKKTLLIMFDYHLPVEKQTQCEADEAIDVQMFLHRYFKDAKKDVDFFLEVNPYLLVRGRGEGGFQYTKERGNYIHNIEAWLSRHFEYERNADRVKRSTSYPNVRFHYIDFRGHFSTIEFDVQNDSVVEFIDHYRENLQEISGLIRSQETPEEKRRSIIDAKPGHHDRYVKRHILGKLLNRYSDERVRDVLVGYIKKEFMRFIKTSLDFSHQKEEEVARAVSVISVPEDMRNGQGYGVDIDDYEKSITFLKVYGNRLYETWMDVLLRLVDFYFIRRFLDKRYIRDGVLYCGGMHGLHIIMILVKFFGFRIEHAYFSSTSVARLNKIILGSSGSDPSMLVDLLYPPTLIQCSEFLSKTKV